MEIQDHNIPEERQALEGILRIHAETGIPLVATNDAHYTKQEDWYYQDVLLCIQTGKTVQDADRMRMGTKELYLKSEGEMRRLFPDHPEAVENTQKIADRCNFAFTFGHYHLPKFPLPEGWEDAYAYLQELCRIGFEKRYAPNREDVLAQLQYEQEMIAKMGFAIISSSYRITSTGPSPRAFP